jgi:23S rRNA (pseudouridine1915-N3)-methyltransferase
MIANIICVGKLKEKFYAQACGEYLKRLSRYGKISVSEVADEREPERLSAAEIERVKDAEGQRMLRHIKEGDIIIALCVDGERLSSESFASTLENISARGRICFILGGSLGISESVLRLAHRRISLSDMTMPHQLARVFLLEQIYRAAKISAGERYHK